MHQAEQYLIASFQRSGLLVKTHGFRALGGTYHNVVATLPTVQDKKAQPLLIGAHYDTVAGSPGADDNASATQPGRDWHGREERNAARVSA